jgi:hypothetical protein
MVIFHSIYKGLPGVSRARYILQWEQGNKAKKIITRKGICKLDEQGNMIKSLRGARKQRKFQREHGNTDNEKFKSAKMASGQ